MMLWISIFALLLLFVGYTVLLNVRPIKCPACHRMNIFRRRKTGHRHEERDEEGDLRRVLTEYSCKSCDGLYWILWDDFEGTRAYTSSNKPGPSEPG